MKTKIYNPLPYEKNATISTCIIDYYGKILRMISELPEYEDEEYEGKT